MVASPLFNLLDDPTDPRHFGASSHDGEGLACRRNVLINEGRLRAFVYDTNSARRAGHLVHGQRACAGGIAGSPSAGCRALTTRAGRGGPGDHSEERRFRCVRRVVDGRATQE